MNHLPLPSVNYLRSRLRLERSTGYLFWKHRLGLAGSWNTRWAGKRAGSVKRGVYRMIRIDRVAYLEHRIVFALANGRDPGTAQIDHREAGGSNRPKLLRAATPAQNNQHRLGLNRNNTSGVRGVRWSVRCSKWWVEIKVDYEKIYLGIFADLAEATEMRRAAESFFFGEFSG